MSPSLCDPQVLLEILSGLPPVDENHDPQFLVRTRLKQRGVHCPSVKLDFITLACFGLIVDCAFFLPSPEMEAPSAIEDEDEELTFEGFLDTKMEDVELGQAESVYTLACSCLQDRKNQRPLSKQVSFRRYWWTWDGRASHNAFQLSQHGPSSGFEHTALLLTSAFLSLQVLLELSSVVKSISLEQQ